MWVEYFNIISACYDKPKASKSKRKKLNCPNDMILNTENHKNTTKTY